MNLKVNKKLKVGLISVLILLTGLISFVLYNEIKHPGYEEKKVSLYSYNNQANINYRVFLKPNILYEANSLDEGMLYITEYIDHIQTIFSYKFTGDREADIVGTYDITAKVQGFTGDGEEIKNIWEKDFVLVQKKGFNIQNKAGLIKEEIDLRLDEYSAFASEVMETSKINCQTALAIIMNINFKGNTDKGPIEDTISPTMIIPLNTNMFQISGNTTIEKPESIEETRQVQLPINKKQVIFYGSILGVLAILLIFIVFFTKGIEGLDLREKKLKQIFKKHGDRLVALNSELEIASDNVNQVKSINDLVRIADEIGKPIMYKYSEDYKDIERFYLTHEDEVYVLDINEMIKEEMEEDIFDDTKELIDKIKNFKPEPKDEEKEESKIES